MLFYFSKRLPFGFRAGVAFDPSKSINRPIRTGGSISGLGEGVTGIYVITGAHNMCKVGISTDPELRLAALQTGSHVKLKLHYVLAVKSIDPRAIEALAHVILDKYRCSGEWFDIPPHIAEDAVNQAAGHYGIKTVQVTSGPQISKRKFWTGDKLFFAITIPAVILIVLWLNS